MTMEELILKTQDFLKISDEQKSQFVAYLNLIFEKNKVMNLTSITDMEEAIDKHLFDCLLPLKIIPQGVKEILDVGSGAGFPGIVWAIAMPNAKLTLIDATKKKCDFLNEVVTALNLKNVRILNLRAEDYKQKEKYDLVTARAVSSLPILLEITAPFCKVNGYVLALKGKNGRNELEESLNARKMLKLEVVTIQEEKLFDDDTRINILFKKKEKTAHRYPRAWGIIQKSPL